MRIYIFSAVRRRSSYSAPRVPDLSAAGQAQARMARLLARSSPPQLERCLLSARGVTHELSRVAPLQPHASLRVVCVPGNPGCSAWYDDYSLALHERLGGRAEVVTLGYAGHGLEERDGGRVFSFEEQSQQLAAAIGALADEQAHPGAPFVLVGHSIGGYFCLESAREAQLGERVAAVVGLTPFLESNHKSGKQRFLRAIAGLFAARQLTAAFVTLVNLLPRAVQTLAVGALAGLQGRAADVALTTLVNRGRWGAGLRNYTFMGSGEMEAFAVRGKYCREHLRSVAQKTMLIYAEDDHWAPTEHRDAIANDVPEMRMASARGFEKHDFPTCERQSLGAAEDTIRAFEALGLLEHTEMVAA